MELLTEKSLDDAIEKCKRTENYRVLIVTEYLVDQDFIKECWLKPKGIYVPRFPAHIYIQFDNTSMIYGINLDKRNTVGQRADLILCESWMMQDKNIRAILKPIEQRSVNFKLLEV